MMELNNCRKTFPKMYIRMTAFDSSHGWESPRMSFIVNRPKDEPGFLVEREERNGRTQGYAIKSYATKKPDNERY
jgi:ribulose-bisphosphate carboxylase small chain